MGEMNGCEYPMCPSAKDVAFQNEKYEVVVKRLDDIANVQMSMGKDIRQMVVKLEQFALLFSEINHLKEDVNKIGGKVRSFETDVWKEINGLKERRETTLRQVVMLLIVSGVFGVGGFFLARLWEGMFGR